MDDNYDVVMLMLMMMMTILMADSTEYELQIYTQNSLNIVNGCVNEMYMSYGMRVINSFYSFRLSLSWLCVEQPQK